MFGIEKIAESFGNRPAYVVGDEEVTYSELWSSAADTAELLKKQGEAPVIIYGNGGADPVIAMIACLLAGRAYVPVSAGTPEIRLKKIIDAASCSLVLKTEELSTDVDVDCASLYELRKYEHCGEKICESDTAYIIFTSGSTGKPKGVPISKGNLENFINWIKNLDPLSNYKNAVVLNTAPFSFDLSVAAVYYALCCGHTLVSSFGNVFENYGEIFSAISSNRVNVAVMTPTFGKLLLLNNEFKAKNYPDLSCIYFCGERLEKSVAAKFFSRFSNIKIINAYGPTEATSAVSAIEITREMLESNNILPVGSLNTSAVEVKIENGEIILKGKSVFSGYLNVGSENFFSEDGENCFKTGDLGYIDAGKIYCTGRRDNQIKYKGCRIELEEIETVLNSVPGVREGAAVAKKNQNGEVKLIKAFVAAEQFVDESSIRLELKKCLPSYMVPKTIELVEKLPVNKNGKIDRKLLAEL